MKAAVEALRAHWDRRARQEPTDLERIDSSARSQDQRFFDLARQLKGVRSVLDVGCGVGDLYSYLREHGDLTAPIQYTGVDLSEEMIRRARQKYPKARFEVGNVLDLPDEPQADAVVAIGIHHVPVEGGAELLDLVLRKQFALCRVVAHASLLSLLFQQRPGVQAHAPGEVFALARRLAPFASLQHDYLPHDFSVTLRREQVRP